MYKTGKIKLNPWRKIEINIAWWDLRNVRSKSVIWMRRIDSQQPASWRRDTVFPGLDPAHCRQESSAFLAIIFTVDTFANRSHIVADIKDAGPSNMDETRNCRTSEESRRRDIIWHCLYAKSKKEMIQMSLQNRNRLTDLENKLMVAGGGDGRKGSLGSLGSVFKRDNQQGPSAQPRELRSVLCGSRDGRGFGGEWVYEYIWLSPSAVRLEPSWQC